MNNSTDVHILLELDSFGAIARFQVIHNYVQQYKYEEITGSTKHKSNCIKCKSCDESMTLRLFATKNGEKNEWDGDGKAQMLPELLTIKEECDDDGVDIHDEQPPADEEQSIPIKDEIEVTEEFSCIACKKIFKTKSGLTTHLKFCKKSKENFAANDRTDSKPNTKKEKKHFCDICDKELNTRSELEFHLKECSEKMGAPTCKYCNKNFKTWTSVKNHKRLKHENEVRFTCEKCGYRALTKATLNQHIIRKHYDNPRPFICDICNKTFTTKSSVSYHIQLTHLNYAKYVCQVCSMKFMTKSQLETHVLIKHTTGKTFPCPQCSKMFKSQIHVKNHVYKIHTCSETQPKLSCDQCNYKTHYRKSFDYHKMLHLEEHEKPFQCKFCTKGFPTLDSQRRHEMSHTDERPFNCKECGKGFRSRSDLKIHMRYHTGEKPYECEVCHQRYADRGCYRIHLIGHERQLGITLNKSVKKFVTNSGQKKNDLNVPK